MRPRKQERPALPTDYRITAGKGWSPAAWFAAFTEEARKALELRPDRVARKVGGR